jgi:hypothetical protein
MKKQSTVRRSVVFSKPQKIYLECEAGRLGISIGELIRRIIDNVRSANAQAMKKEG